MYDPHKSDNLTTAFLVGGSLLGMYLSRNAKVDDARLFVLAPKAGEGDRPAEKSEDKAKDSKAAPSRADFSIRN